MLLFDPDILRKTLENSPEVAAAYLFGSAGRKEAVVNDLDILLLLYPHINADSAYFDLIGRIADALHLEADRIDLLFFDLGSANPEVLYQAVSQGILLKEEDTALLTDRIEELSSYFLRNEYLIRQAGQLRKELVEEFCAD